MGAAENGRAPTEELSYIPSKGFCSMGWHISTEKLTAYWIQMENEKREMENDQ
jgi:hypothetical protein